MKKQRYFSANVDCKTENRQENLFSFQCFVDPEPPVRYRVSGHFCDNEKICCQIKWVTGRKSFGFLFFYSIFR